MQFALDESRNIQIRSYLTGELRVGKEILTSPVILSPASIHENWSPPDIESMTVEDFDIAITEQPEVILFGTGPNQIFPPLRLISTIMQQGIGFEYMDTAAACRTFNVLAGEGRRVVAALLLE